MSLEGPILKLPNNQERKSQLKRKLKEYAKRVEKDIKILEQNNPNWHPSQIEFFYKKSSSYMKLTVLSELFFQRELNSYELCLKLSNEELIKNKKDLDNYNQACGVINDYCETGGANCINGTGLE